MSVPAVLLGILALSLIPIGPMGGGYHKPSPDGKYIAQVDGLWDVSFVFRFNPRYEITIKSQQTGRTVRHEVIWPASGEPFVDVHGLDRNPIHWAGDSSAVSITLGSRHETVPVSASYRRLRSNKALHRTDTAPLSGTVIAGRVQAVSAGELGR